jgi:hypothetical protein
MNVGDVALNERARRVATYTNRAKDDLANALVDAEDQIKELIDELQTLDASIQTLESEWIPKTQALVHAAEEIAPDLLRVAGIFGAKQRAFLTNESMAYNHEDFVAEGSGVFVEFMKTVYSKLNASSDELLMRSLSYSLSAALDFMLGHKFQWHYTWNLVMSCKPLVKSWTAMNYLCHALLGGPRHHRSLDVAYEKVTEGYKFVSYYATARINKRVVYDNIKNNQAKTSRQTPYRSVTWTAQQIMHLHDPKNPLFLAGDAKNGPAGWKPFKDLPDGSVEPNENDLFYLRAVGIALIG